MSQDGSMIEIGSSFVRGFRKFNVERSAILVIRLFGTEVIRDMVRERNVTWEIQER